MKLISILLNEIFDIESSYEFKKVEDVDHGKGLGRVLIYKFCTDGDIENCDGFVYKVELKEDIKTRGKYPPIFDLSFNVPTETVDDEDQYKTKAAKGDAGNRSFDTLTNEQDSKVLNTVVLITHKLIEQFNKDYPVKDGGYAITWEGTFGPEYSDDAGQSSKDSRENIYKYAVYKFKRHHKNLEVVDDKESPTKNIQLRFNGWSSDEKKFL